MMMDDAYLDAELGPALNYPGATIPPMTPLEGRYVRLEKLDPEQHTSALFAAQNGPNADPRTWLYMTNGPFTAEDEFRAYTERFAASSDPLAYTVIPVGGDPAGIITYLRIDATNGSIEIGHIWYGASIQRSPVTTEVVYLTAKHAFEDLGYRRFEWKCHNLNERSKRAAVRFGFKPEGVFRNHIIQRGRNRDTAWFAMTDQDWPVIKAAFEAWLDPANFDANGRQMRTLESFRTP